jgi:hypothetical protein
MLIRSLIEAFGRGEQVSPETYDTLTFRELHDLLDEAARIVLTC